MDVNLTNAEWQRLVVASTMTPNDIVDKEMYNLRPDDVNYHDSIPYSTVATINDLIHYLRVHATDGEVENFVEQSSHVEFERIWELYKDDKETDTAIIAFSNSMNARRMAASLPYSDNGIGPLVHAVIASVRNGVLNDNLDPTFRANNPTLATTVKYPLDVLVDRLDGALGPPYRHNFSVHGVHLAYCDVTSKIEKYAVFLVKWLYIAVTPNINVRSFADVHNMLTYLDE